MGSSELGSLIIVDDDAETLAPLLDLVSKWGYEASGVTSGRDALDVLKKQSFHVLLTDLVMPEMDGIALFKAAIDLRPMLVCIIVTGKGTVQSAVEAMKLGAFDYVAKPMDFKMLQRVLSRAMDLSRLRHSEEKYRSIVEDQTEFICRWQPDGTISFVNEVYCRAIGSSCQELLGENYLSFFPERERRRFEVHIASLSKENPASTIELCVETAVGGIRWQRWTNRALFDRHGCIAELQSVGRDVTERKRAEEALFESRERLRALTARLAEVEEAERKNLARELHDTVGQNLTALGINLNIIKSQIDGIADSIGPRLQDSLLLVEQTATCIRDVMADLRPEVMDDYGLIASLRWYGERFSNRTGLHVTIQEDEGVPRLPLAAETALFRITQEALTNVVKHAQASEITITLQQSGQHAQLIIADDGRGFDLPGLPHIGECTGWGLITMEERAAAIGGRLSIISGCGRGTIITVEVNR